MSLEIIYKNIDGELITSQQLSLMSSYFKHYYLNNQLKKIEKFGWTNRNDSNMILKAGEYYLDETENIQDIIAELVTEKTRWELYYNKSTNSFGDYSWEYIKYEYGVLKSKDKYVFNSLNELIAECSFDIETNEVYFKHKYLRSSYGVEFSLLIEFDKDNDNNILKIIDDDIYYYSLNSFLEANPSYNWYAFPYFHSFNPMLPNTPIV